MTAGAAAYPRLLGDIGGTHARWAWQDAGDDAPRDVVVHRCAEFAAPLDSARRYLADRRLPAPRQVAVGVATAVTGDQVRLTNHPWSFSVEALRQALGAERIVVVNDFTALALALPVLRADERVAIGGGSAVAGGAVAVLGPGTGLGVSGLVPDGAGGWLPLAGEGGHVTLAAADDADAAVLARLRERFGHVSAERVLSGPGLVHLAQALSDGGRALHTSPAEVTAAAQAGDATARQALRLFAGFLGNVAGNLALTLGARGGVYIGGGVVPRLGAAFDAALFRRRFEAKGRFGAYLRDVPTWLVTATTPALRGAARALDDARLQARTQSTA